MIEIIDIRNFKSIKSASIRGVQKVTLVGGKNNCGKTTLLEAIGMLFGMQDPNIIGRQLGSRGVNFVSPEPEFMWGPVFHNFDLNGDIDISAGAANKLQSIKVKYKHNSRRILQSFSPAQSGPFFPHGQPLIPTQQSVPVQDSLDFIFSERGKTVCISHLYRNGPNIELHLEKPYQGVIRPPALFLARIRSDQEEDAERFGRLDLEGRLVDIVDILCKIEPSIRSLSLIRNANTSLIYADVGIGRKVPVVYMGDGVSRLLSIALAIATSKDGVVLVDEIENGIHHSVITRIWEALFFASEKFNCQIIATTHSLECLTSAYKGSEVAGVNTFTYIRLQNKGNEVVGKIFTKDLLKTAIESELEVR